MHTFYAHLMVAIKFAVFQTTFSAKVVLTSVISKEHEFNWLPIFLLSFKKGGKMNSYPNHFRHLRLMPSILSYEYFSPSIIEEVKNQFPNRWQ